MILYPTLAFYNRSDVEKHQDYLYIFTDNLHRTSGNNNINESSWYFKKYYQGRPLCYPTKTQALIRGLPNAFPITTMIDPYRTQWTDSQLILFQSTLDAELEAIKKASINYKGIVYNNARPFGQGTISNMAKTAPYCFDYLCRELNSVLGIDNYADIT